MNKLKDKISREQFSQTMLIIVGILIIVVMKGVQFLVIVSILGVIFLYLESRIITPFLGRVYDKLLKRKENDR